MSDLLKEVPGRVGLGLECRVFLPTDRNLPTLIAELVRLYRRERGQSPTELYLGPLLHAHICEQLDEQFAMESSGPLTEFHGMKVSVDTDNLGPDGLLLFRPRATLRLRQRRAR